MGAGVCLGRDMLGFNKADKSSWLHSGHKAIAFYGFSLPFIAVLPMTWHLESNPRMIWPSKTPVEKDCGGC